MYAPRRRIRTGLRYAEQRNLWKIHYYEFNYKNAKAAAKAAAGKILTSRPWLCSSTEVAGSQVRTLRNELTSMESSARDNKQKAFALVEKAHKASMKSIHSTTSNLDIGLKALQFTRDTSADVFLVCAGLLTPSF